MLYKDKLDSYKVALYCSEATLTSKFSQDLQTGTCYKRYGQPADIIGMMLRPILAHKVHPSPITSAFQVGIEKEAGVSEDVEINIDGTTFGFNTDNTAKEVLAEIKEAIEANTDYYVDIYADGLYAYSYSGAYDFTTTFTIIFGGSGTSSITSMEGIAEDTLLDFWNCLTTETVVDVIEFMNRVITDNTKCN